MPTSRRTPPAASTPLASKQRFDAAVFAALDRWVAWVRRHATRVATAILLATLPLALYAATHLGVNVDTVRVIHPETPSRVALEAFSRLFPILNEAILVVIDAQTPDQAREATDALADALRARPEEYRDVYVPGGGEFFARNGLLYLSLDELDELAVELARAQPLIAELERDPSLVNLGELVERGLDTRTSDSIQWSAVLDRVTWGLRQVEEAHPIPISWEDLLMGEAGGPTQRVLLVEADIDPNSLFDAGRAAERLRGLARELGFGPEHGVEMRLTGNPVLNHEEIIGLLWDIGAGGVLCFLFVVAVLVRAFRSWRMTLAAIATLLVGLVWTGAFAAATVGNLNVISLSFAILFIGLGIDFTIHLGMHYAAARQAGQDDGAAMREALRHVGSSLLVCTLTTATGFYVFVPTYYAGVAELGLIAGSGMFIVLFLTLSFLPALLASWLHGPAPAASPHALRVEGRVSAALERHPVAVCCVAAALGVGAAALLPQARFDANNVRLRDPGTESVRTFDELLAGEQEASPWFANALAPDFEAAGELARRLASLEVVANAVTLIDYVPTDQAEKREVLADIAFLLETPETAPVSARSAAEERDALVRLADLLAEHVRDEPDTAFGRSARRLEAGLRSFLAAPDPDGARVSRLHAVLLDPVPGHIERLRRALHPEEVGLDDLPQELVRRMVAPDGRIRIQIFPAEDLRERGALPRFVREVRAVEPSATGMAVNLVGFGDATVASFQQALVSALALITLYLLVLWRRARETLLVLAPLLLGAVLTVAGMVLLGLAFNFVNVIVIPLLLGIGVDSGIHLVHRACTAEGRAGRTVESPTARAVLFSAMTTIVSFGALALSSHRGMSSLGVLLTVGLCWMLVCNLVVLPALIQLFPPGARRA